MGAVFLAAKVEESFTRLSYVVTVFDHLLRRTRNEPMYPPLDQFSQVKSFGMDAKSQLTDGMDVAGL